MITQKGLERRKNLVVNLILAGLKPVMMVSLSIDPEFRAAWDLTGCELMRKFENRIKPYPLKLYFPLRNPHFDLNIGVNSAATINCPASVGMFLLGMGRILIAPLEVVVVE